MEKISSAYFNLSSFMIFFLKLLNIATRNIIKINLRHLDQQTKGRCFYHFFKYFNISKLHENFILQFLYEIITQNIFSYIGHSEATSGTKHNNRKRVTCFR